MDIRTELDNYLAEKRLLVEAAVREFRAGASAAEIARALAPAFSRDIVTSYLAAIARADSARTALAETSLNVVAAVHVSGIDAPREATVSIGADPAEIDDIEALPHRIRAALAPFHLALALPRDKDPGAGETPDEAVDRLMLEGEPVLIVRAVPRR
ncbi:hypothetical protein [Prescottella subtropica]|uniref:hypothetical protein n=1 Tax=Prescottella subtropica TaxID=2545757 RepID=UPI0010F771F1|nr:hypothetical protein [Prescottella subtropica]